MAPTGIAATVIDCTTIHAPYAASFKLGIVQAELGSIADITVDPAGYDKGQLKERKRRLGRIGDEVLRIITGLDPMPLATDEAQQKIIHDACRDAMLSVLSPQCATRFFGRIRTEPHGRG